MCDISTCSFEKGVGLLCCGVIFFISRIVQSLQLKEVVFGHNLTIQTAWDSFSLILG